MRPSSSRITTCLCLPLLVSACGHREEPVAPEASRPSTTASQEPLRKEGPAVLTLGKTLHDFGTVDDTRMLRCEFPFENKGGSLLEIREMKSSCGCTTPALEKTAFAPGEGDIVHVEWKPKGRGPQTQTVDLFLADRSAPERLTIRAHVIPKIQVSPLLVDFERVPQHTSKTTTLELKSSDPEIQVLSVVPKVAGALIADFVPGGASPSLGTLNVQLLPRARGAFGTSLTIRSRVRDPQSGESYEYEMDVPVRASIYGAVQLEPNAFYVGKVDPQGKIDYRVRLRRPDGTPFGVVSAAVQGSTVPGLEVVSKPGKDQEGDYIDLNLEGDVGDYLGPLRAKVILLTDVPGDTPQELSVMGVVRQ